MKGYSQFRAPEAATSPALKSVLDSDALGNVTSLVAATLFSHVVQFCTKHVSAVTINSSCFNGINLNFMTRGRKGADFWPVSKYNCGLNLGVANVASKDLAD